MAFPFQHTEGGQAAGDVMQLRPLRASLTAAEAELILTHFAHCFALRPDAIAPAPRCSRQCQAVGRLVLGAVSDDQDVYATCEPASGGPIGMATRGPDGVPVEASVLLQAADTGPAIVVNALQQGA